MVVPDLMERQNHSNEFPEHSSRRGAQLWGQFVFPEPQESFSVGAASPWQPRSSLDRVKPNLDMQRSLVGGYWRLPERRRSEHSVPGCQLPSVLPPTGNGKGSVMSGPTSSVTVAATPAQVFRVLSEPRTYPDWLVGARTIRSVDLDWPSVGSAFRHRIGVGPVALAGSTTVRRSIEPIVLELAAGMGPLGRARVVFRLEPVERGTLVTIEEEPEAGAARIAWNLLGPLLRAALWGRNSLSLATLAEAVATESRGHG